METGPELALPRRALQTDLVQRIRPTLLLTILFGCLLGIPSTSDAEASKVPSCVRAKHHARYLGFAWDHVVTILNDCKKGAACVVTTSANPDPIDVQVEAKTSKSVLTYRANPSREFTYELSCSLR